MRDKQAMHPGEPEDAGATTGKNRPAPPPRDTAKPYRLALWALSIAGAVAIGAVGADMFKSRAGDPQPPLEPIVKMGQLVSLKLNYAEIHEFTEKRALGIPWSPWEIRMGGTTVVLVAKGDCSIATDLNAARYEKVDVSTHSLVVSLPSPQPFQARVNHESRAKGGSYIYALTSRGVEALIPDSTNRIAAINDAYAWAQGDIRRACSQRQVIDSARENAEKVLRATLQPTGWNPTFVWR